MISGVIEKVPTMITIEESILDKSDIKDIKDFWLQTKLFDLAEGHPNACGITIKKDNMWLLTYWIFKCKTIIKKTQNAWIKQERFNGDY